ncbi:MAG TPA: BTAD domain-containing putative transcriptional regulator, partial [Gemmatimonadaceae bacterium]|nr:BTAD domain-containing putative transcriptional regulator [Gemmatimonadaceae bacterium]
PDVAPEYEEWVDRTRARLRRRAAAVAWTAAEVSERQGDGGRAVERARRACELELDHEAGWRKLMNLQQRLGDRPGALRSYNELCDRLDKEFGVRPSAETIAVAESIRAWNPTVAPVVAESVMSRPEPLGEDRGSADVQAPQPVVAAPRRSARPYAVAFILLLLVALGGFAALRYRGERRDVPSLVASGALAARDRIVVGDFADGVGDTSLAAAITQAMRVDLSQSPFVRVLSPTQLRSSLVRMQRSADLAIDDSLAREIALREGAKAYVTGAVAKVGSAFTVTAQLVSADRGEVLAAVRETAADSTQLIAAVDRTSRALRYRIGESLRELRDAPALSQVTTASLPALRAYTRGYGLFLNGHRSEALPYLQDAVALDTGFATAYRAIATIYASTDEPGRSAVAGQHAMANGNRLPFRERQFLIAGHAYASGDYETAIRTYEQYLQRYPHEAPALSNMALAYRDWRKYAPAESLYREAIKADSSIAVIYYGLHSVLAYQGKFAESRHTLDEIARRYPGDGLLTTVEVQDAAARQDWDEAERRSEGNIASMQGDTLRLVDAFEQMAGIVETQGRLAEAERAWRTQLRLSAASRSSARHIYGISQLALIELRYRRRPDRARAMMDSALASTPLDSILPGDRPYYELARFYAAVGDVARARTLLARATENDRALGQARPAEESWGRGVIAIAASEPREAESELRQASDTHICPICPLPDLARAYEVVGKPEAALLTYERYANTPWLWRYETDASELWLALNRMGELYAKLGDNEKAAAAYARLARLWRRADPDVQHLVSETKLRGER